MRKQKDATDLINLVTQCWGTTMFSFVRSRVAGLKKSYHITALDRPLRLEEVEVHEGGKVSPTHRPPLPIRRYPCYSFLLEAKSAPGPYCDRKD